MIKIENLKVRYGTQTALNIQQPITIEAGDRIGIIGSNGAGKSTLIKTILKLIPYQGKITRELEVSNMAVQLQFNEYVESMSCLHVMEALLNTSFKKDVPLQELVDYFEMGDHLRKKYKTLSGGQKQRFTLIMVLYQRAPLTLFDEVTSGLDFETRQKLIEKIQEWYKDSDAAFCMVSHYYEELEQLVNKILLLEKGQVVAFGDKADLFQQFCGYRVVVIERTPANVELVTDFRQIASPDHEIALSVSSASEEQALVERLIAHDVNYRRTSNDIELMTINAKAAFAQKGGHSNV